VNHPTLPPAGSDRTATNHLYEGHQGLADATVALDGVLAGGGTMAGNGPGAEDWSVAYDRAARQLLAGARDMANGFGVLANLSNAALANHRSADAGAVVTLPTDAAESAAERYDGDPDPAHDTSIVIVDQPPGAYGDNGGEPGLWGLISGKLGHVGWPSADVGRIRTAAAGWRSMAAAFDSAKWDANHAGYWYSQFRSPDVTKAQRALDRTYGDCADLADGCTALATACTEYADNVETIRDEITDLLADLTRDSVITWAIGGALTTLTVGGSAGAATSVESALVARTVVSVGRKLDRLAELVTGVVRLIADLPKTLASVLARIKRIASAKPIRASFGRPLSNSSVLRSAYRQHLLDELRRNGVKFTEPDLVTLFRDRAGKVIFLERGSSRAGLKHILRHSQDFANKGISPDDIPSVLKKALTEGSLVPGGKPSRPIYAVKYRGETKHIAITVSDNGYIVGANPVSIR